MKRSHAQHAHTAPVDIVGIPESDLRAHLEHILDRDSVHATETPSLLGLAHHLDAAPAPGDDLTFADDVEGHEDMLPQLRLVDALLGKLNGETAKTERRPFAELIAAEQHRRQRRKRLSRNPDSPDHLPPPSPQAENDRLLLEEIGRKPSHPSAGWTAEPQELPASMPVAEDSVPPPSFSLGDDVMDLYVAPPEASRAEPAEQPAAEPPPPIALKVKRKVNPPLSQPVPPTPTEAPPANAAASRPAVKLQVKGRKAAPAPTEAETPQSGEAKTNLKSPIRLKGHRRSSATATPSAIGIPAPVEAPPPAPAPAAAHLEEPPPAAAQPAETAPAAKPAVKMRVKGKPRRHAAAPAPAPAPVEVVPPPAPAAAHLEETPPAAAHLEETPPAAKPAVKMKVKGKPRRHATAPAPTPATDSPAPVEVVPPPAPAAAQPEETPPAAKPAVKMKVKGKPRRHAAAPAEVPPPPAPAAETTPPAEAEAADKPAVTMKVKGKPRRSPLESAPGPDMTPTAPAPAEPVPTAVTPEPPPLEAASPAPTPRESMTPPDDVAPPEPPSATIQIDDPLLQRVEDIIAAHAQRSVPAPGAMPRGSHALPENREALAKLLDDVQPASDFEALDLVYACWSKTTHESDSRALLAVAQQISRHFGLPDKLPMASTKAWKMLDGKVFAPELADRLAAVGQFIVDWQKTQRVFLILEFSEIELIEYLFEALSPADYPDLLAEVMNFKVLSNRRMGLLRRFPARLRKQTQPLLPDRKEEALVIQAHGKALLQKIADPRGFAPIVEVAGKMLEEVEKLMKQTATTGAPPQLGGPPGGGGGGALGRIG